MDEDTKALYLELARIQLVIMIRDPDAWDRLQTQLNEVKAYAAGEDSELFHSETELQLH
jgi:hypothetical protein